MFTQKKAELKQRLLLWMEEYCCGYRKALKKHEILSRSGFQLSERLLRKLMSELKHERHIASHSSKGYWFIPLQVHGLDPSSRREEINAVIESWEEMKAKAFDMLRDCDKEIRRLEAVMYEKPFDRQLVIAGLE